MSPWGHAGERLSAEQARQRTKKRLAERRQAQAMSAQLNEQRTKEAQNRWANGLVRPDLITMWLDFRNLAGPEVDRQCGVSEPTVDLWEAGRIYPTWEQLTALAALCQVPVWRFTDPPALEGTWIFICGGRGNQSTETEPPITQFDPLALAAAGISPYPITPSADEYGQTRLL